MLSVDRQRIERSDSGCSGQTSQGNKAVAQILIASYNGFHSGNLVGFVLLRVRQCE